MYIREMTKKINFPNVFNDNINYTLISSRRPRKHLIIVPGKVKQYES